jgi:hypothetical protein
LSRQIEIWHKRKGIHLATTFVDDEDYEWASAIGWCLNKGEYVFRPDIGYLHRMVMKAPPHLVIDHINHDPLDNRKENLRLVTRGENVRHRKSYRGSRSRFRNVYFIGDKPRNFPWAVMFMYKGAKFSGGYHATQELAHEAAVTLRREILGERDQGF